MDTALAAAVDVAAVVFTVRRAFARRHVLAEAGRYLLKTLRGRAFPLGLDTYIADKALARHSRQLTVPQPGRRTPAAGPAHLHRRLHLADPMLDRRRRRQPPWESSRYKRARLASLALQNAIRDARIAPLARDGAPAAHTGDHDQAAAAPHAVDHSGRDAALAPAQRAAAVHVHQQAAMPEEYLEGRTTDPATWLRTPKNLARLAAFTRAAEARTRTVTDGQQPKQPAKDAASPADQCQHHTAQPDQGRGAGPHR
ncbi:hypothetical protein [Streptomyces sp. enrichment culture]|uniref:hypothetical protein n=1 Tax=Streptomyces sp. enrichment culture TaxID=1795815 RepID=UPI003F564908